MPDEANKRRHIFCSQKNIAGLKVDVHFFYISLHPFLYIIFYTSYFHIFIFCNYIFQGSGKSKLEDTCLTSWKTLLDTNLKFNFFYMIFSRLYISYLISFILYFQKCTLSLYTTKNFKPMLCILMRNPYNVFLMRK